jgi:hypothetical protein
LRALAIGDLGIIRRSANGIFGTYLIDKNHHVDEDVTVREENVEHSNQDVDDQGLLMWSLIKFHRTFTADPKELMFSILNKFNTLTIQSCPKYCLGCFDPSR